MLMQTFRIFKYTVLKYCIPLLVLYMFSYYSGIVVCIGFKGKSSCIRARARACERGRGFS